MAAENGYALTGRVVFVGETENVSKKADKPFYKRVIVLDDEPENSKYPNPVPFEATGDKCDFLNGYQVGETATVKFFVQGRGWKDPKTGKVRFFCSNHISFIERGEGSESPTPDSEGAYSDAQTQGDGVADDMPF